MSSISGRQRSGLPPQQSSIRKTSSPRIVAISALVADCIARGKTIKEGGAVYDVVSGLQSGLANVANALMAIKVRVFEEGALTLEELERALKEAPRSPDAMPVAFVHRRSDFDDLMHHLDDPPAPEPMAAPEPEPAPGVLAHVVVVVHCHRVYPTALGTS